MAYTHVLYEVKMTPQTQTATTVWLPTAAVAVPVYNRCALNVTYSPTGFGAGVYQPLTVPVKIHRIGIRMNTNPADPGDLIFWKRQEGGATAWPTSQAGGCTGEYFRFMYPTIAATGKVIWKNPTANYIVYPGESLCVAVSTVTAIEVAIGLLVSPVWEELGNVTQASKTTAP